MAHRALRFFCVASLAALAAGGILAEAGGAGGILFGTVQPGWNPTFLPAADMPLELESMGGFGYGLSSRGAITGGFGMAMLDTGLLGADTDDSKHLAAGFGGMLMGRRIIAGEGVNLDFSARLGLGGLAIKDGTWRGWAAFYAEPRVELGIGFAPWMRLSAALGYLLIGNLVPGAACEELFLRSPTLDITIAWGKF